MSQHSSINRRQFVRSAVVGASLTVLASACARPSPQAPASGKSAPTATSGTSAATQITTTPTAVRVAPTVVAEGAPPTQLPRNESLVFSVSDSLNQMTDASLANPFVPGIQRTGWHFAFEPLFYYNQHYTGSYCEPSGISCKDGEIPWLAESYAYNNDFTQLSIKIRPNVTWSDGVPFTAKDVAFTINMLKDNAPKLLFSVDMKLWVKEAAALDEHTVQITLNSPNPRFFLFYLTFHDDLGFPPIPEHIYKGKDPTTFTNLDLAKGWPVVTGPWKLLYASSLQKIWGRRDDWWAAKTGFHTLPAMKQIIVLPSFEDSKRLELLLNNQVDSTHDMQVANVQTALARNPKLKVWTTNNAPPYGCSDAWTNAMSFNCSKPPFDDPEIRWAVNYAINRDQVVQIGYHGAGKKTVLPFPDFPPMKQYFTAVQDLLEKYPVGSYNPTKSAQIMQSKGYAKDAGGFWAKDGKRLSLVILLPPGFFEDITPVIVAQLRKAGFASSFKEPTNGGTIEALGTEDAFLSGITGSVRDPYETLSYYHSRYATPTNQPSPQPYRWKNSSFDTIVDQMSKIPASDSKFRTLYHRAMEIWLKELPSIPTVQWIIRIPVNTTYWTGWPDEKHPYIEPSNWHRTVGLFINSLQPAK